MKKYHLICLLILVGKLCTGQNPDNFAQMVDIIPPAPNAASIIKNGMLSVNQNTGSPNVNIPLYSINGQKLSLGVSLNYATTGLKVDEISGRVGMGWSLNAGGVVTRTLRGKPDELTDRLEIPSSFGPNCDSYSFLEAVHTGTTPNSGYDSEPDLFNFNMNGMSGSFVLDASMQPVLVSKEKLKIEMDFAGTAWNVRITDLNGIQYLFGGTDATEKSKSKTTCGKSFTFYRPSAWYLKEIKHPNGELIELTYTGLDYEYDTGLSETMTWDDPSCPAGGPGYALHDVCENKLLTEGKLLSTISNPYTKIKFIYGSRTDVLDDKLVSEVQLIDQAAPLVVKQKFIFTYTNYTSSSSYPHVGSYGGNITPFLASLNEKSGDLSLSRNHGFVYNDPAGRSCRLSFSQDHWGYFNGSGNTTLLQPSATDPLRFPFADADRSPSESFAKKGLLTKIWYPTGGWEEIEYEINKIYSGGSNVNAGGLRVSRLLSYNPGATATTIIKKYFYGDISSKTVSTLHRADKPEYQKNYVVKYADDITFCGRISLHSNSLTALNLYQGAPISYASVIESHGDDFENGGIQTKFLTAADAQAAVVNGDIINGAPLTNASAALNGRPVETTVFKKNSAGNLVAVKKTEQVYYQDPAGYSIVKGWIANKKYQYNTIPTCPGGFVPPDIIDGFDVARYEIWGNWVYLQSSTETTWDEEGLNPVVKSTDYYHDDLAHLLVTKIETTDGENRTLRTELKYPTDYPGNAACSSMVTKNILAPVINFKQTKPATSTAITEVETTYSNAGSDNFVPAEIKKSIHGGSLVSEGTFNSYDSKGNLLQYTDKSGVISSIVWGYNYLYPVAKVTGASYASVIATLTGGSVTALQTMDGSTLLAELNNIRTGLPNALVTSSTYKHLAGVSAMVDANNRKSSYEYDAFNRLVMVRDQDGYVVKKICYNYDGQTEDCTSECTNTTPNWQNTETAQRCELGGSCSYTGYMEQEQVDQNTCSPTHLQTRWVQAAYNPTGCASSGMLSMSVVNNAAVSGYVITYTKTTSPYTSYTFTVPSGGGVVGCIPSGTYNVNIHKTSGFPPALSFSINGSYVISTSATFYNIVMNTFNTANRTTTIDIAD